MLAVTNGNSELAHVLVDHGAQVDCTDKHLRTALHRAVSTYNVKSNMFVSCRQLCTDTEKLTFRNGKLEGNSESEREK